jgi:hypothetical protein
LSRQFRFHSLIWRMGGVFASGSMWRPSRKNEASKHRIDTAMAMSRIEALDSSSGGTNDITLREWPTLELPLLYPRSLFPRVSNFSIKTRDIDVRRALQSPRTVTSGRVKSAESMMALMKLSIRSNRVVPLSSTSTTCSSSKSRYREYTASNGLCRRL